MKELNTSFLYNKYTQTSIQAYHIITLKTTMSTIITQLN